MNVFITGLAQLGGSVRSSISTLGFAMRMLGALFANVRVWWTRTRLVFQQIHFFF